MATKEVRPASRTRVRFPILPPEDLTGIPPGPRVPRHLLGASWLLREHRLLERCRRRYGNVFSLNVWPMGLVVVICDPAEIKRVFTGDSEQLEAGAGNAVLEPLGGPNSLFILDGEEHLHQRRLMLPPFHGKRIGVYGDLVTEITETEIDRMPLDKPFELHPHMLTITLAVILRAVFGIEDADRREELESIIPELLNSPVLVWPPLARDFGPYRPRKRFRELRKAVNAMLYDEIERKRVDPRLEERDDVLSMLILARDENGEGMTDVDLRDQLITLLLAGHESTATTLAWTFERLLRNPQVLDRLRSSLAEDDETYLDCTIKESLRSRPIVPYAVRRLSAPMEVGGYTVPTGAFVGISTILTHSRADLYPEPEAFRPERFLDEGPDTYTWVPFGGGVRRCIGATFATFEMKQIVKRVLARCDFVAPDPRPEPPAKRFVTYRPKRGTRVILEERRPAASA